ncbi:MAG: LysM peptidoglycan-binding domain-containing protein [Lachnospiraceae bacterium]|nr:LysM peptidoglycan-binding domain-containing protein [Lachnospiraceae bacterium]
MEYCDGMMVAVKQGDTLYSISMKYKIPLALLLRANPYVDVYNLQVGETICVPVKKEEEEVCRFPYGGQCNWNGEAVNEENRDAMEQVETDREESNLQNIGECTMSCQAESSSEEQTAEATELESKNLEKNNNLTWERYVAQPGDTLDMVVCGIEAGNDHDKKEMIEKFVEKNGMDKIYLLPGVAFYRQR